MAVVIENPAGELAEELAERRRATTEGAEQAYEIVVAKAAKGAAVDVAQAAAVLQAVGKTSEQFQGDVAHCVEGRRLAELVGGEEGLRGRLLELRERVKTALARFKRAREQHDETCRALEGELAAVRNELASIDKAKHRLAVEFPETAAGERLQREAHRAELDAQIRNLNAAKLRLERLIGDDRELRDRPRARKKRRKPIMHPLGLHVDDSDHDATAKAKSEAEERIRVNTQRLKEVDEQLTAAQDELKTVDKNLRR